MTSNIEEAKRIVKEKYPDAYLTNYRWSTEAGIAHGVRVALDDRWLSDPAIDEEQAWLSAASTIQKGMKK